MLSSRRSCSTTAAAMTTTRTETRRHRPLWCYPVCVAPAAELVDYCRQSPTRGATSTAHPHLPIFPVGGDCTCLCPPSSLSEPASYHGLTSKLRPSSTCRRPGKVLLQSRLRRQMWHPYPTRSRSSTTTVRKKSLAAVMMIKIAIGRAQIDKFSGLLHRKMNLDSYKIEELFQKSWSRY